jgi:hypothetical protein
MRPCATPEEAGKGYIEIASAQIAVAEGSDNHLAEFFGFGETAILQGMRKTEVAILGAILEDERHKPARSWEFLTDIGISSSKDRFLVLFGRPASRKRRKAHF